jgi:hypothetical protein
MKEYILFGLQQMGNILIDVTFTEKSNEKRKMYKTFNIELKDEPLKSRLGCYNIKTKTIEISGIKVQPRSNIFVTYLHELSHHIEMVEIGKTNHQQYFYEIHIRLLKKAIDLNVISVDDIINDNFGEAQNKNKIARYLGDYKRIGNASISDYINTSFFKYLPETVNIEKHILVKCPKEEKDKFKTRNYKWNKKNFSWEITTQTNDEYVEEKNFLEKEGYKAFSIDGEVCFTKTIKISLYGNTFENKEIISSYGYSFYNKRWHKNVDAEDIDKEIKKIKKIKGIKIKYSF